MAAKLIVTPEARGHLDEAAEWYERDRPGRGKTFLRNADKCFVAIRQAPRTGRPYHGPYRQKTVPRFPYIAVFRYDAATKTATVAAVFHTSRDPDDLLRMLP